jgi:hypothetical protein
VSLLVLMLASLFHNGSSLQDMCRQHYKMVSYILATPSLLGLDKGIYIYRHIQSSSKRRIPQ